MLKAEIEACACGGKRNSTTFPRCSSRFGDAETLLDDSTRLADRAKESGVDVTPADMG